eukprot:13924803-Alexandrium_andersonii.AAC.1
MSASLVGSEMCIRDSAPPAGRPATALRGRSSAAGRKRRQRAEAVRPRPCLLYTSDAADDM